MTTTFEDYDAAVRAFWTGRELQTQKQIDRYRILFDRLVRERLYDATCLVSTVKGCGIYDEPVPEVSATNLTAAIAGRVAYIRGLIR